jgi:hypothetical protein
LTCIGFAEKLKIWRINMAYDPLRNRATETNFCVGYWYDNKVEPLHSGRLVRDLGDEVVLTRMGVEFSVEKKKLEAARELR